MAFLNSKYLFQYYNFAIHIIDNKFFVSLFCAPGDVESEDVSMYCNPSYVLMESYHQSKLEEATVGSFHQPASPDTLHKDWFGVIA